ncbi:STM4504/CBY_0614 family protein [Commensalibacter communis]|uniref:STM4504/CBY_0614 family protein n=1 Tax=Commensalibacter communis TaxID=2972786 RepID=UPI0022FF80D7|nr:hypothetical protein [Commensalibacter communis]CAI3953095.1 unnamed protein product [Commensalibacter communis]CAI3953335.1 unnamed protein product [Commensalibacter communis]
MAVANIYSRRLRASQSKGDDVYQYDTVPDKLRTQLLCIMDELFSSHSSLVEQAWQDLCKIVAKECGVRKLRDFPYQSSLVDYIEKDADLLEILDFCNLLFIYVRDVIESINKWYERNPFEIEQYAVFLRMYHPAIEELNTYFKESALGYEYNKTEIIRIDSQHIHKEIIKPVLQLLGDERFQKVDAEYRLAHQHYRNKLVKDCVVSCNRAFETMLKTICDLESWDYQSGVRASDLITLVRNKNLFQDGMANNFNAFIARLKNRVPALRNEYGGHGEGSEQSEQPLYMGQYLLNLTASNVMFLYRAWEQYTQTKS